MAVRRPAAVRRPDFLRRGGGNDDLQRDRTVVRDRPRHGGAAGRRGRRARGGRDGARRSPTRVRVERRLLPGHHRRGPRGRTGGARRRRPAGHDHRDPPATAERTVPPRRGRPDRLGPRQRVRRARPRRAADGPPGRPPGSGGGARRPPPAGRGNARPAGAGRHVAADRRRAGQLPRDQRHRDDPDRAGQRDPARVARRLVPAGGRPRLARPARPRPGRRQAGGRLLQHRGRPEGWRALLAHVLEDGRLVDVCFSTGAGPTRRHYLDRPAVNGADDRGGAMVLGAALEYHRLQER